MNKILFFDVDGTLYNSEKQFAYFHERSAIFKRVEMVTKLRLQLDEHHL